MHDLRPMRSYRTIVVAVDLAQNARTGIDASAAIANRVDAGRLHLVHAVDGVGYDPNTFFDEMPTAAAEAAQAQDAVQAAKSQLSALPKPIVACPITTDARLGRPADVILESAAAVEADLIVLTTRDRTDLERFVLGSVAAKLVRRARVPVLVMHPGQSAKFGRALAAVDRTPVAEKVVQHACAVADSVRVFSVFQPSSLAATASTSDPPLVYESAEAIHTDVVAQLVNRAAADGVSVELAVLKAEDARRAVIDECAQSAPELLVVGTSSHSAWHDLLVGSTAKAALTQTECAVLVVRFDAED